MKVIKQIKIEKFRSFESVAFDVEEINVFSGANNAGKSNVLKALNLFFNNESSFGSEYSFDKDFNLSFSGDSHEEKSIKITLVFYPQKNSAVLNTEFSISRKWNKVTGAGEYEYDFIPQRENTKTGKIGELSTGHKRAFSTFRNKLEYLYIPAIRDKKFVSNLLTRYQDLIKNSVRNQDFDDALVNISEILTERSEIIGKEFKEYIGLDATAILTPDLNNILQSISIEIKTGIQIKYKRKSDDLKNLTVDVFSSGDGVIMSYLAYFIAHLSENDKKIYIWGYEEPETALEYGKAEKLAEDFSSQFVKNSQIFLTTHSPAFIEMESSNSIKKYRVVLYPGKKLEKGPIGRGSRPHSDLKTIEMLEKDLERLDPGDDDYQHLYEELGMQTRSQIIHEAVSERDKEILDLQKKLDVQKEKINSSKKPLLLVEDTYSQIYKIAYLKLKGIEFTEDNYDEKFDENSNFVIIDNLSSGGVYGSLNTANPKIFGNKRIVGLFDYDNEGVEKFRKLKSWSRNGNWEKKGTIDTGLFQRRKKYNIYALLLPIPDRLVDKTNKDMWRSDGSYDLNYVEIETLLPESFLENNSKCRQGDLTMVYKVKDDKKNKFWKDLIPLEKESFTDFKQLFITIHELLDIEAFTVTD